MAVLKPRERLVYFRISEDEFHQFLSVCEQEGARSLSDLARNAVQRLIASGNRQKQEDGLAPRVEILEKLIAEVSAQLQLLATLKSQPDGGEANIGESLNGSLPATNSAQVEGPEEESQYANPA